MDNEVNNLNTGVNDNNNNNQPMNNITNNNQNSMSNPEFNQYMNNDFNSTQDYNPNMQRPMNNDSLSNNKMVKNLKNDFLVLGILSSIVIFILFKEDSNVMIRVGIQIGYTLLLFWGYTMAKQENLYIREYLEHYKSYGINKIFLYDNNDIDGEKPEDVISDYIKSQNIEITNSIKNHNVNGLISFIENSNYQEEITQEKILLEFNFQNAKMPYESYKGDYASVKYYIKVIIISSVKNTEYEKEFAVVNPYDNSILQKNDEPIYMQVGMKNKMSLSIFFQHKNYNCRGTLKGFITFNYLNINLKFMEVQIVRREIIFGDKKCEPAYVARYELIDGVPTKNERIPIRFFLKSYNLTPTYPNIDNVFCVPPIVC